MGGQHSSLAGDGPGRHRHHHHHHHRQHKYYNRVREVRYKGPNAGNSGCNGSGGHGSSSRSRSRNKSSHQTISKYKSRYHQAKSRRASLSALTGNHHHHHHHPRQREEDSISRSRSLDLEHFIETNSAIHEHQHRSLDLDEDQLSEISSLLFDERGDSISRNPSLQHSISHRPPREREKTAPLGRAHSLDLINFIETNSALLRESQSLVTVDAEQVARILAAEHPLHRRRQLIPRAKLRTRSCRSGDPSVEDIYIPLSCRQVSLQDNIEVSSEGDELVYSVINAPGCEDDESNSSDSPDDPSPISRYSAKPRPAPVSASFRYFSHDDLTAPAVYRHNLSPVRLDEEEYDRDKELEKIERELKYFSEVDLNELNNNTLEIKTCAKKSRQIEPEVSKESKSLVALDQSLQEIIKRPLKKTFSNIEESHKDIDLKQYFRECKLRKSESLLVNSEITKKNSLRETIVKKVEDKEIFKKKINIWKEELKEENHSVQETEIKEESKPPVEKEKVTTRKDSGLGFEDIQKEAEKETICLPPEKIEITLEKKSPELKIVDVELKNKDTTISKEQELIKLQTVTEIKVPEVKLEIKLPTTISEPKEIVLHPIEKQPKLKKVDQLTEPSEEENKEKEKNFDDKSHLALLKSVNNRPDFRSKIFEIKAVKFPLRRWGNSDHFDLVETPRCGGLRKFFAQREKHFESIEKIQSEDSKSGEIQSAVATHPELKRQTKFRSFEEISRSVEEAHKKLGSELKTANQRPLERYRALDPEKQYDLRTIKEDSEEKMSRRPQVLNIIDSPNSRPKCKTPTSPLPQPTPLNPMETEINGVDSITMIQRSNITKRMRQLFETGNHNEAKPVSEDLITSEPIPSRPKTKPESFDGLMEYLQDYRSGLRQLLVNNNLVVIEPVRGGKVERTNSCRIAGATVKKKEHKLENATLPRQGNDDTLDHPILRRHFFYHPIRVNRSLVDEELPDPDVVRAARQVFEQHSLSAPQTICHSSPQPQQITQKEWTRVTPRALGKYLSVDAVRWDEASVSSGVGSSCDSDADATDIEDGHYISPEVLDKIRACGSTITYYGGRIIERSHGPRPMTREIMREIQSQTRGVKFRLVKSNSCGSRLELAGAEDEVAPLKRNPSNIRALKSHMTDEFKKSGIRPMLVLQEEKTKNSIEKKINGVSIESGIIQKCEKLEEEKTKQKIEIIESKQETKEPPVEPVTKDVNVKACVKEINTNYKKESIPKDFKDNFPKVIKKPPGFDMEFEEFEVYEPPKMTSWANQKSLCEDLRNVSTC